VARSFNDDDTAQNQERPMNSSTLTGLAAVLFACGLIALFAALYRDAAHGGPLLWVGIALLVATVVCWFAAARTNSAGG
jgi:Flp pilus assembly protein TadB